MRGEYGFTGIPMGYQHRIYRSNCGNCGAGWILTVNSWEKNTFLPRKFTCDSCGAANTTKKPSLYPNVPRVLYCGHERNKQLEIYPYPLHYESNEWALPYSIRSFVYQASQQIGKCDYRWNGSTVVMGEPVHQDVCGDEWDSERCHPLSGWIRSQSSCPMWEDLKSYCQTLTEQRFLWAYLSLAKGRNFPMLLPQVRVGIAERRRPDFVLFNPLQYLIYKRYAVELDGAHTAEQAAFDEARDMDLAAENYEVLSLRPKELGYFPEVQKLVEKLSVEMTEAERSAGELATDVGNATFSKPVKISDDDIPF
jgi:hypothetical protein